MYFWNVAIYRFWKGFTLHIPYLLQSNLGLHFISKHVNISAKQECCWGKSTENYMVPYPGALPPQGPLAMWDPTRGLAQKDWTPVNTSLPVTQTAENHGGNDAEGEDVQHIGQEHLPLLVQAILALLVTDSSQHRNWTRKAGFRTVSHHTAEGGRANPNRTWGLSGLNEEDWLGLPSHAKRGPAIVELYISPTLEIYTLPELRHGCKFVSFSLRWKEECHEFKNTHAKKGHKWVMWSTLSFCV